MRCIVSLKYLLNIKTLSRDTTMLCRYFDVYSLDMIMFTMMILMRLVRQMIFSIFPMFASNIFPSMYIVHLYIYMRCQKLSSMDVQNLYNVPSNRDDICRDRWDQRSRKFFVDCVNFSVNNANCEQNLPNPHILRTYCDHCFQNSYAK